MTSYPQRSRKQLFWLIAISIVPIIISWILYHYHASFHFKTLNYGTLITPPLNANDLALNYSNSKKWQIAYIPDKNCDADCEKLMFTLHQLRIALGKDRDRVNLILIVGQSGKQANAHDFEKIIFADQQYGQWQKTFNKKSNASGSNNFQATNKIYLIDPIGNIFMYYSDKTNPMNILKDLKQVLNVSQIG